MTALRIHSGDAPTTRLLPPMATVLAAALIFATGAAGGTASFADPAGDAKGAPDVTSVAISSDASGMIQLSVTVPGLFGIDRAVEPDVDVYLDTDKNVTTGSPSGSEYDFWYGITPTDSGWDAEHWVGSAYKEVPATSTMTFSRSGDTLTWRFSRSDIGGSAGFNLHAISAVYDAGGQIVAEDDAPDGGVWVFDLGQAAVIQPALGRPLVVPARATAGKLLSISFPVIRVDTGAALTGGTLVVKTAIGGRTVPNAASLSNATANVAIPIPRSAKGKTLQVKATVTVGGRSATRTVSYTIR